MASADDTGEDDVQWEYEYDDNETEDFYLTLDLTTHVSNAVAAPEPRKRNRAAPKGKRRPETTAEQSAREEREAATAAVTTARLPSLPATGANGEEQIDPGTQEAKLQILDLHSENPYVKFVDGVYSCNWHTDLSTQVYVARPGVTETPLRPGNVVDVVGLSRMRLVGKPVTLQPKPKPAVLVEPQPLQNEEDDDDDDNHLTHPATTTTTTSSPHPAIPPSSDFSHVRPGDPLIIPRDRVRNEAMEQQASFLEQLSAIKLKRGETDLVPVSGVRYYDPPADKEGIRARAVAAAAAAAAAASEPEQRNGDGETAAHDEAQPPSAKRRRISDRWRGGADDDDDGSGGGGGEEGDGLRFHNQTFETFARPEPEIGAVDDEQQQQQAQPGATAGENS
ncbi:hypothetical protein KC332_g5781 [Hortaea werneckii]|uniref:Transcription factor TFIIIC triple barrel domain-containing protein n=1 Tax=Hortaea werneckii TaxID=91943 RepID=A0A3M7IKC7_HORWE|nr:hypothetical protein KC350_g5376 [Hortaea werneckii]KAI6841157.1 hypothetical protein KC358_g4257 [Hortaea werneckii]KAI6925813.1 hypothetical protein KC341_g13160 [Hortaea werneckii]KAI6934779.1 hypothetical protein KC348_g6391 [Hortaea werneckii]KAI6971318.1 hypothetical protein KC321_g6837 [Hortaea werneckii]